MSEKTLNPKEEAFCMAYASAESKTYSNATASAEVAGYASPANSGWKLRQRPVVQARLAEIYKANASDVGRVMSDLRRLQLKAEDKGDLSTAAVCLKLQGQRYGMFTERMLTFDDDDERAALSEREREEAQRIANIRLREGLTTKDPTPQTEASPPNVPAAKDNVMVSKM